MKSLSIHSAVATENPGIPPKLKPFKELAGKMSRSASKAVLCLAAIAAVLSIAPDALAAMQRGARGAGVAQLQSQLGIPADGVYGPQTEAAVAAFQARCGLAVDGIAGPQTLSAISSGTCYPALQPYQAYYPPSYNQPFYYQPSEDVDNNYVLLQPAFNQTPVFIQPSNTNRPPNEGFIVVIPGNDAATLQAVRQLYPFAAIDGANAGPFINVGTYPTREDAVQVSNRLIGFGFPARIESRSEVTRRSS